MHLNLARSSIRFQLRLLLVFQTLFLVVISGIGWYALDQAQAANRAMSHRGPLLKTLNDLRFQFQHTRAGQQALLAAARNEVFLKGFRDYVATSEQTLTKVLAEVEAAPWEADERTHLPASAQIPDDVHQRDNRLSTTRKPSRICHTCGRSGRLRVS